MMPPDAYEIPSWALAILFWRKVLAVESKGIPGTRGPRHDHDLATEPHFGDPNSAGALAEGACGRHQSRGLCVPAADRPGEPHGRPGAIGARLFPRSPSAEFGSPKWVSVARSWSCRGPRVPGIPLLSTARTLRQKRMASAHAGMS